MSQTIGEVVKRLRHAKGLSTYELARISNGEINRNWLSSLEGGQIKYSSPKKIAILAKYLGTTVADIYQQTGIVDIYEDIDGLPPDVREVVEQYNKLAPEHKPMALRYLQDLNAVGRAKSQKATGKDVTDAPLDRHRTGASTSRGRGNRPAARIA